MKDFGINNEYNYYIYFDDDFNEIKFGKIKIENNEIELNGKQFTFFYSSYRINIFTADENEKTYWLYFSKNILNLIDEMKLAINVFAKNVGKQNKFLKFYFRLVEKYKTKYPEYFI